MSDLRQFWNPTGIPALFRILILTLLLLATRSALAEDALDLPLNLDIPANSRLEDALIEWGERAGMTVMMNTSTVTQRVTHGVTGTVSARKALDVLLRDSGLSYKIDGRRIQIIPSEQMIRSSREVSGFDDALISDSAPVSADTGSSNSDVPEENSSYNEGRHPALEEVVVTAQKREERLQDVPVPVTAISAETLGDTNQVRIQDYYTSVPGLNLVTDSRGTANVSIRGVTTGYGNGNPTVGVTLDDVPFGSSSSYGGGVAPIPDIDPSDLTRIEVLRGPQGTLYGASSLGGMIKFVTADPSTVALTGRVEAGMTDVTKGNQLGYSARASVNVPVSDTFAFRTSMFFREDPGYIDNVQTGQHNVNSTESFGGRISALWKPADVFSYKLSALYQDVRTFGSPYADPTLGDLKESNLRYTGIYDAKAEIATGMGIVKLGDVTLTAITGYSRSLLSDSLDDTPGLGGATQQLFGVSGAPEIDDLRTDKFSQEVRLSGPAGSRVDWLAGLFYTHEASFVRQDLWAQDPTTNVIVSRNLLDGTWPTTFEEYAAFFDLTFHMTGSFDIQFGGRESYNRQTYSEIDAGLYGPVFLGLPDPVVSPEISTKDNAFTYLVTPELKLSQDLMVYARIASGYRAGGPNPTCTAFHIPCHFEPDRTTNYELGVKGDLFDRLLSVDASLYYISWKKIQLSVVPPNTPSSFFTNGGDAKSQGIELALTSKPMTGLTMAGWVSWDEAVLTQDLPSISTAYGLAGDRLPNSSRFSGNFSVDEEIPFGAVTGFVGGSVSYIGMRESGFASAFDPKHTRLVYPPYAQVDLKSGARVNFWNFTLFAKNVTNRRGILQSGANVLNDPTYDYIQPLTLGLSVAKSF